MFTRLQLYLYLLLFCLLSMHSKAQLGGTYTIDSSVAATAGNYKNFNNAITDLLAGKRTDGGSTNGPGISNAVVFKVSNGIYYEKLQINPVKGASTLHTITFTSAGGDSSKVILIDTNSTIATNNYTIYLNAASFFKFQKITIARGGSGNYTNVIQMDNHAKGNSFLNNKIIGKKILNYTSTYPSLIYSVGNYPYSNDSGNTFRNNLMKYNAYGFTWYATSYDPEQNTIIDKNIIDSMYYGGIYMLNQKGIKISSNTISNIISNYGLGIYSYYSFGINQIIGNKILLPNGGEALSLEYNGTISTDTSIVANNFISVGGDNFACGINVYNGDFIRFYYNNILIYGSSSYASYAASLTSGYVSGSHFELINNNLVNSQASPYSYAIYNANAAIGKSDYNNIYSKGTNLAYSNTSSYSNLKSWINGTALDSHSLNIDPLYKGKTDLHVSNVYLNKKAIPLHQINNDIDGEKRDPIHPDIGADEFAPIKNDAGIEELDSPSVGCSGSRSIYVKLRNYGLASLSSVNIEWTVDTGKKNIFKFIGTLGLNADTLLYVGSYNFYFPNLRSKVQLKAWTKNPNGVSDSNNSNDSINLTLYHGISGSYTVGGISPSFSSFNDAVSTLMTNGVCGTVTINVRDGIYNEQIDINKIAGTNGANKVVFQSQSGDSSKVILNYPSSNNYTTKNFTVSLSNVSNITFKKISIIRSGLGYYGNTVQINNNAVSNQFINNLIISSVIPASDYYYYSSSNAIYSTGTNYNGNIFKNNLIKGGYYNCTLISTGLQSASNNTFINNTFDSSYWGAINLQNQNLVSIKQNIIRNIQNNYGYGIAINNGYDATKISGNSIVMLNGGIPIYLGYGTKGASKGRLQIFNNFISLAGSSGIFDAGIQVDNADSIDIIYNNLIVYDPSASSSVIYLNSVYASVNLYNNNIMNAGGGYALYVPSSLLQASNNNNFFVNKGYLGYYNASNIKSLNIWKSITTQDSNSINKNPLYYSFTDLHVQNSALDGAAKVISWINSDFDGQKRNLKHPDIGADEFTPLALDAGVSAIDSPQTGFCSGLKSIYIHIRNYGTDTIKYLNIKWQVNGVSIPVTSFSGNLPKGEEQTFKIGNYTFSTGKAVSMQVYCYNPNGKTDSNKTNDTINIILNTGLKGNYTIGGSKADYPTFTSACADIMNRGLCGASIFNVSNGVYNEQISLGAPTGLSSKNTLKIQSISNDSSAVILSYPSSNIPDNNYTFLMYGTKYLTIKGITIARTGNGLFNNALVLTAECQHNTFTNNQFIGTRLNPNNAYNYNSNSALIFCVPSGNNYNTFSNNYLKGNYWGFSASGENAYATAKGLNIKNNIIDSTYGGVFLEYEDSFSIFKNTIRNLVGANYGIQAYYGGYASDISKNYIFMPQGGYGLYLFFLHGTANSYLINANNIIDMGNSGAGIYASYLDYSGFYYNTVRSKGNIGNALATFIGYGANTCELYNNIFQNQNGGLALSGGKNIITNSNYNDFSSNTTNIINWDGTFYSSIKGFKSANALDNNSLNIPPSFSDSINLILSDTSSLIHHGMALSNISDDIYGSKRNKKTPDIGAVELDPQDTDLAVLALTAPVSGDCADSISIISVLIKNNGLKAIKSFSMVAKLVGSSSSFVYSFPKGAILNAQNDTIINFPGYLNTTKAGIYQLKIYSILSGDQHHFNDTILSTININTLLKAPFCRNGSICGSGSVKLIAISNDSVVWLDSNGTYLASGDTFKTAFLTRSTKVLIQGNPKINYCGPIIPDSAGGYNASSNFFNGLKLNALENLILDSLTIYPASSGVLQLNLRDSNGKIIVKQNFNISISSPYSPVRIHPNFKIPQGNNYIIDALNSTISGMYANGVNSKGSASYPYVAAGLMAITNTTDTAAKAGKYYYFYNWRIIKGFSCASELKEVKVSVGVGTPPKANFNTNISCNGIASFQDSSVAIGTYINSYTYEFGDSTLNYDTSKAIISHYYKKRGNYRVLLSVSTKGGCSDSVSKWINISPSLSASFYAGNKCLGDTVQFIDSTFALSKILHRQWNFNDGDSSNNYNPVHLYKHPGKYKVQLSVSTVNCTDTTSHYLDIYPNIYANFSVQNLCFGDTTLFQNKSMSTDSNISTRWILSSGDTISQWNARHQFQQSGPYHIYLNVNTSHHCNSQYDSSIFIYKLPSAQFTIKDSSTAYYFKANDSTLPYYFWDFGDSNTLNHGFKVSHNYLHTNKYNTILKVMDSNQCSNTSDSILDIQKLGVISAFEEVMAFSVYPNPFEEKFILSYKLKSAASLVFQISDLNGKIISVIHPGKQGPGTYQMLINNNDHLIERHGVYLLRILNNENATIRLLKL